MYIDANVVSSDRTRFFIPTMTESSGGNQHGSTISLRCKSLISILLNSLKPHDVSRVYPFQTRSFYTFAPVILIYACRSLPKENDRKIKP
jgi:hypothetical protein